MSWCSSNPTIFLSVFRGSDFSPRYYQVKTFFCIHSPRAILPRMQNPDFSKFNECFANDFTKTGASDLKVISDHTEDDKQISKSLCFPQQLSFMYKV